MAQLERRLAWDGCANVRDLGGHTTVAGGATRFGSVVRADLIRRLSDSGWRALVNYGVRTIVDLRFREELEADPPAELPVDVVHISLLGTIDEEYGTELDALARSAGSVADGTKAVYLEFLERFRPNFAAAIRAIADAPDGGVLVHCAGGKDRTGLVVALLLSLAGVPREDIAADYALSERNLAERTAAWLAGAGDDEERERIARIAACPPEAMHGVLDELDRRYGGVREYLRAAGLTDDELDRAASRLVTH